MAAWLYQSWFGASLLARIMRSRKPLDTAMANTRRVLGLHQDV
jgi:TetR/AcrR family transcriptional repressor of nem operon